MPPNLRYVIERVTRAGRSVVSSRNFSSCPNCGNDSKEAGGRVVAAARLKSSLETRTKGPDFSRCFAVGFLFCAVVEYYKSTAIRDKQVLNAGQHDLRHGLK